MKKFKGIFPALVTPFDEKGNIAPESVEKLVEHCLEKGVRGFYVGGSTGESYLLSAKERRYMLELVIKTVRGRADVIANIGVFSTDQGIELAKHAESLGVSAVSSVPPFYFPFTMEEYIRYYNDLADAVNVPVIIYNIPAMSGITFNTEDIERFFSNDKIIGMKHTSYDLFQLERILKKYPEKSIFCGHDELFLSASVIGVQAGIGSTFNIMPDKFVKMQKLISENRWEDARKIQDDVNEVIEALTKVGVFKGVKAALKLQGIDCGECRRPFASLDKEQIKYLQDILEKNNCL
ncbi:MAG TPA: N-acetylneuraminate lyase [Candidatus Blautia intestinavium]|nr:N-acetylneuraminate lyase [Candidatus Blautia intestinavium]